MLLSGILAGAGWMAVTAVAHREAGVAVAQILTTTPAATTTTSSHEVTTMASTSSVPSPRSKAKRAQPARSAPAHVTGASVVRAVRSVDPSATAGVLVVDRRSGTTLLSVNAARRFHSASLVKLLIAIDVLRSGQADGATREMLARMLRMSDDNLANLFWVRQGYGALVTRTVAALGLHDTAPPTPAGRWGNTWLSPRDIVTIYDYVLERLPSADRDLIVKALASAPEHAADGFDQWFGIPDGQRAQWAIKQGWSTSATDTCLHSTGLVGRGWRYVVVVLTEHPRGTRFSTGTASATAGVRALAPLLV